VAKAIRDGVIDATIDHAARVLRSNPLADGSSAPMPVQSQPAPEEQCKYKEKGARTT
jgi:putative component of membrane protein insertase Oxa1/YidC/SpoIIIJ protein YidD